MTEEEARRALSSYDSATDHYYNLPEREQEGSAYEYYEDTLLDVVHVFAEFVREHTKEQA